MMIGAGFGPAIAADPDGVHVAFFAFDRGIVHASSSSNGGWNVETVDATGATNPPAIALVSGAPRLAYHEWETTMTMRFADRSSGSWSVTEIEPVRAIDASLASDGSSDHVLYSYSPDASTVRLRHASRAAGGTWARSDLALDQTPLYAPHIALDPGGTVHAVFIATASPNHEAWYGALAPAGAWSFSRIDAGDTDFTADLAVRDGQVHATYFIKHSNDAFELRHAERTGTTWTATSVDTIDNLTPESSLGGRHALAIDAAGAPHIAYEAITQQQVKYAHRQAGAWVSEVVGTGGRPDMIEQGGELHLVYETMEGDIFYAHRCAR